MSASVALTSITSQALNLLKQASSSTLDLRRFECLSDCGSCCRYKVSLREDDITRMTDAGHSVGSFMDSERKPARGFVGCLAKGPNDFCIFLDDSKRCSVYETRPFSCRSYPFIREAYVKLQLDVDLSCPGVGQGPVIGEDEFHQVIADDGSEADHAMLLQSNQRAIFAAKQILQHRAASFESFDEVVEDIISAGADGLAGLKDYLTSIVPRHSERLLVNSRNCEVKAIPDDDAQTLLRDYLLLWTQRQVMWRWADAILAVTPTLKGRRQTIARFLLDLCDVLIAEAAGKTEQEQASQDIHDQRVQQAIRKVDSYYRTYCQSFSLEG